VSPSAGEKARWQQEQVLRMARRCRHSWRHSRCTEEEQHGMEKGRGGSSPAGLGREVSSKRQMAQVAERSEGRGSMLQAGAMGRGAGR